VGKEGQNGGENLSQKMGKTLAQI